MLINGKEFYYDITIQAYFYILNKDIVYTNKEHIKKELYEELGEKHKNDKEKLAMLTKELNKIASETYLKIESVIPIFEYNKQYGLYKENNIIYFNFYKPTKLMLKCENSRKDKKNIHNDINFYKKYKSIKILLENLIPKENELHYFLNWLSYVFNTKQKTRNTIVIKGIQGTGKGVFAKYILEKFYEDYLIYTSNDDLNTKFNSNLQNKLMNIGNELINFEDKKDIREKLKQWITDDYIRIEEKGIKAKIFKNTFNMLIFSNNKNPVNIESSDRRFTIIETNNIKLLDVLSEKRVKSDEFFTLLVKESESFIQDLYLYNYNKNLAEQILENEEKEDIRLDTEQKYLILKRKLETNNKNFFLTTFVNKFLFDIDINEYEKILKTCKLGFIKNYDEDIENIEYTHNVIVNETFKQLEQVDGVESKYLLYYLFLMYGDKFTKKQLEQKLSEIGKGERVYIFENGRKKQVRIRKIKIVSNNNYNENNENKKLKEKIQTLKKENENLKMQVKMLREQNAELKDELNSFKNFLINKNVLSKKQLNILEEDFNNLINNINEIF